MSKSRFAFDKFAKLIEQGLVNYKDISGEIVNRIFGFEMIRDIFETIKRPILEHNVDQIQIT